MEFMKDWLYYSLVSLIRKNWLERKYPNRVVKYEFQDSDELPDLDKPAIYVANHWIGENRSLTPCVIACSLPVRFYPWIASDLTNYKDAHALLKRGFIDSDINLDNEITKFFLSLGIAMVTVPMIRTIGVIPVYSGDTSKIRRSFEISLEYLREGKSLLIFPEDSHTEMRDGVYPFQSGVGHLVNQYQDTGDPITVYPIAVDGSANVIVGYPVIFQDRKPRREISLELEKKVRDLYNSNEDSE